MLLGCFYIDGSLWKGLQNTVCGENNPVLLNESPYDWVASMAGYKALQVGIKYSF